MRLTHWQSGRSSKSNRKVSSSTTNKSAWNLEHSTRFYLFFDWEKQSYCSSLIDDTIKVNLTIVRLNNLKTNG